MNDKQLEKERRRNLFINNREEFNKEREKFVRGVSKNFKIIHKNMKEEIEYLDEQTKMANNNDDEGDK